MAVRTSTAAVATVLALTAVACGTATDDPGAAPTTAPIPGEPAEVPSRTPARMAAEVPLQGHPAPDRWRVEVAHAIVPEVTVHRELPPDARISEPEDTEALVTTADLPRPDLVSVSTTLAAGDGSHLMPIPSPGLQWGGDARGDTWVFEHPTVIGSPLVFLVTENRGEWMRVMAPLRPLHQEGWVRSDEVRVTSHSWHVQVNVTTNRLEVWDGARLVVDTATVDGALYTPTPLGRFYINERQRNLNPAGPYGTWILSLNAFSNSLERFNGVVPIVAIHGTPWPDTMGNDLSNGCVRIPNDIVDRMAELVPVGTPVDIVA